MKRVVWLSIVFVTLISLTALITPKFLFASTTVRFLYDGDGARVAKIEEGKTILYVGDMEKDLSTSQITKYYGLGGKRVAVKEGSNLSFLVSDHLTSLKVLINPNGTKIADLSYYPYGQIRAKTGTSPSRQYTSQINDSSTGLYFYNARYYNPQTANFIQADSAGTNLNKYAYAARNPFTFTDPSGNDDENTNPQDDCTSNPFSSSCITLGSIDTYNPIQATQPLTLQPCYSQEECKANQEAFVGELMLMSFVFGGGAVAGIAAPAVISSLPNLGGGGGLGGVFFHLFGNKELEPAVRALRSGNYREAFRLAEQVYSKIDPGFRGFEITQLPKGFGGVGSQLSKELSLLRQASLAIHEVSHALDLAFGRAGARLMQTKPVSLTQHYGLSVQNHWITEAKAYLAEWAGGGVSLPGAIRRWFFSTSKFTSFPDALKAITFER